MVKMHSHNIIVKIYKRIQLLWLRGTNLRRITRDFILTGIPRSGTSLMSVLLSEAEDCVCFNEIHYNIITLPIFFGEMRKKLLAGEPVPNKVNKAGKLITNTDDTNKFSIRKKIFLVKGSEVVIGSKVTIPYLNQINEILNQGYKVIIMIRNPVYTLGSWNSKKLLNTPMNKVMNGNLHSHWKQVNFVSNEKIERQAQIWEHYARLIWSLRDKVKIVRYEQFIGQQDIIVKELAEFLGISLLRELENLQNLNIDSRYMKLEEIKSAVEKYCNSRKHFGYL